MSIRPRPYDDSADYWRVREFLRKVYMLNGRREVCWPLLRWDYWRWHIHENIFRFNLAETVCLWEAGGQIAAMLNPDSPGEAFLQVHPDCKSPALEADMLGVAEVRLNKLSEDGRRSLRVWVPAEDCQRQALLAERGFQKSAGAEYQRRRLMSQPITEAPIPAGYTIRSVGNEADLPERSWVSWKTFHPDEPDDHYRGWQWYRNVQRIPLYRHALDLVAVAPGGEHAAFCTAWFDDLTRTVVFEPVGTHPHHRQRGLGKAVMADGLRRAERLGATLATVGSYSAPAHALYCAMGFADYDLSEPWDKTW